ncbi:MAG: ABC transporter permease [Pedosphaera sp.]|nr:ABC transporter permease [Pedosphaera sp.]
MNQDSPTPRAENTLEIARPLPVEGTSASPRTPNRQAWLRFRRNRPAALAGIFLALIIAATLLIPVISRFDSDHGSDIQFGPPGWQHWLGTDVHGRDLWVRTFSGARISLLVGSVGAGVSLLIGVLWGMVAGYLGGRLDSVMMRFVDVLYSMPGIVFVIVLITTLEGHLARLFEFISPRLGNSARMVFLFAGLGAVSWLTMARIVRGQVISLRNRPFVIASRALGADTRRILLHHILPNISGVVIVYLTLTIPSIILYESFLSYLGLGIRPPQASLGTLIAEGASQINSVRVYWWLLAGPGMLLASTLLALNFVGDGLRDALDPKGSGER